MRFSEGAERFLKIGADRLVVLASLLSARGLKFRIVKTGPARHLLVKLGSEKPLLALAAHYDRVPDSPGVLDNSCACLQLVEFAARYAIEEGRGDGGGAGRRALPSILVAFTDAEEVAGEGRVETQGSLALARAFRSSGRRSVPPVLVLDVTGRGKCLAISSAPAELLVKNDMAETAVARGHEFLCDLALRAARRAGLREPERLRLPWSDDLGLVLGGVPALAVTLLPEGELRNLSRALADSAGRKRGKSMREELREAWPRTWDFINGPADGPELAVDSSFAIIGRFLDGVVVEIASD